MHTACFAFVFGHRSQVAQGSAIVAILLGLLGFSAATQIHPVFDGCTFVQAQMSLWLAGASMGGRACLPTCRELCALGWGFARAGEPVFCRRGYVRCNAGHFTRARSAWLARAVCRAVHSRGNPPGSRLLAKRVELELRLLRPPPAPPPSGVGLLSMITFSIFHSQNYLESSLFKNGFLGHVSAPRCQPKRACCRCAPAPSVLCSVQEAPRGCA